MADIGSVLKTERKKRGLTQLEASKLIGISRSYLADIEANRYNPGGKLMMRLDQQFNLFYLIVNDGKTLQNEKEPSETRMNAKARKGSKQNVKTERVLPGA